MTHSAETSQGDKNERILKFLPVFLPEMDECLNQLGETIEKQDVTGSREVLHQMIGATRIMEDDSLESKILELQKFIKSDHDSAKSLELFQKIKLHIDNLFARLLKLRSNYSVYTVGKKLSKELLINKLSQRNNLITCHSGASKDELNTWLSSNEVDLVIVNFDDNSTLLEEVSSYFSGAYIEIPILLLANKDHNIDSFELQHTYPNLAGLILHSDDAILWEEAIKTIANGRNYWR